MLRGLTVAVLVSAAWIGAQIAWMHVRPASNRFRAMLLGYLASLPFLLLAYFRLPLPQFAQAGSGTEAWSMGLLHAAVLHLLIFFFYVECFYHVERSVTLRFLLEILDRPEGACRLEDIRSVYNIDKMIATRLDVLAANNYIERRQGRWVLKSKGRLFARVMKFSKWVFQSQTQRERL